MAVGALVLGILSIILMFIPVVGIIAILTSLIGVVLGAMARKIPENKGTATAGLVLSIVALALSVVFTIACWGPAACVACTAAEAASELAVYGY